MNIWGYNSCATTAIEWVRVPLPLGRMGCWNHIQLRCSAGRSFHGRCLWGTPSGVPWMSAGVVLMVQIAILNLSNFFSEVLSESVSKFLNFNIPAALFEQEPASLHWCTSFSPSSSYSCNYSVWQKHAKTVTSLEERFAFQIGVFVWVSQVVWSCQTWSHSQHMSQARAAGRFAPAMRFLCSQMACGCVQKSDLGRERFFLKQFSSWFFLDSWLPTTIHWQSVLPNSLLVTLAGISIRPGFWLLASTSCFVPSALCSSSRTDAIGFVHIAWIDALPVSLAHELLYRGCRWLQWIASRNMKSLDLASWSIGTQFICFVTARRFNVLRISTKDSRVLPGSANGWSVVNIILMVMYPSFKVAQTFTLDWSDSKQKTCSSPF